MSTPFTKLMEVLTVTFLMTAVCFLMPMLWGTCTPKPVDMEDWTEQVRIREKSDIAVLRGSWTEEEMKWSFQITVLREGLTGPSR